MENLQLMQAIAENKAAKSTTRYNINFWLVIVAFTLNAVAAILGAFFGCPCKDNKSCANYILTAVCVTLILIAYVFSIINYVQTEREKQKSDKELKEAIEQAKAGNATTENLTLAYDSDTKANEEIKRRQKLTQITVMLIMAITNIVAMMALIF